MAAIWAAIALSVGSAAYGASQNKKAEKFNEQAYADSQEGYEARMKAAAAMAQVYSEQYNEALEERPDLDWNTFIKDKIRAIDDPAVRQAYTEAKEQDFARMQSFATRAGKENIQNLIANADELSGGNFREMTRKRDELVMNTNAASRLARTYELAAPLRTGASTVKYDNKGNLIEGQRADAQAFQVAQEVNTAVEQEQKADLRALENDRLSAAQSQAEKARDFMPFFDATGLAIALEEDRTKTRNQFQLIDEQRAYDMYSAFAQGAAGITPTQPAYRNPGPGNDLISSGVQLGSNALSAYGNTKPKKNSTTIA